MNGERLNAIANYDRPTASTGDTKPSLYVSKTNLSEGCYAPPELLDTVELAIDARATDQFLDKLIESLWKEMAGEPKLSNLNSGKAYGKPGRKKTITNYHHKERVGEHYIAYLQSSVVDQHRGREGRPIRSEPMREVA